MNQRLYSTSDVARLLHCSAAWVKLLALELGLKPKRLGNGNLVWADRDVESVRALRERRRRKPEVGELS